MTASATVQEPPGTRRARERPLLLPVWAAWGAVVLTLGLLGSAPTLLVLLLCAHVVLLAVLLLGARGGHGLVLLAALGLRCLILLADLSGDRDLFGSGPDAAAFYRTAAAIAAAPELLTADVYGGVYSKLVGALFLLTGPSQALVQYTNIVLFLCGVVLVARTLRLLDVPPRVTTWAVAVCALLPVPVFFSALFLRESLIFFLVSLSVHVFCRWLVSGRGADVALAVVALVAAGTLHVGVLGILVGYVLAALAYAPRGTRLRLRARGAGPWLVLLAVVAVLAARFPDLFLGKLATIDSAEDLYARTGASAGGSAYLPGVQIETFGGLLQWGGLKAVLLVLAPSPLHWRGLSDVLAFVLDASVHAAVPVYLLVRLRRTAAGVRRQRIIVLFVAWVSAVAVFGAGTANAGTAMRHRQKLLPVAVVACALAASPTRTREAEQEAGPDRRPSLTTPRRGRPRPGEDPW